MRRLSSRLCLSLLLVLIATIALLALVLAALPAHAATTAGDGARVIVKFKALGPLMRAARERGGGAQASAGSTVTPTFSVATPPPRSTPRSGATSA